jgi:uncharacterized protein
MSLQATILSDLMAAMKAQEAEKLGVLRMMKAALLNELKGQSRESTALTDEEVIAVLTREAKKRKEAATAFHDAGREELAQKEETELVIIEQYLPAQATDEEIKNVVQSVVEQMGSAQFGAVMGAAMKQLKGAADGNRVKAMVEQVLSQNK